MKIPEYLKQGEAARLFPVLSTTSKEGRTTSIFLATLARVRELGESLIGGLGRRLGNNASVETYTEIVFSAGRDSRAIRPDGLIVVNTGRSEWRAIVETKVGSSELKSDQIDGYLKLAREHNIDAVITISNQFTRSPEVHPVDVGIRSNSKVQLFHWSWMYILTATELLIMQDAVRDEDQQVILNEFRRFLSHESSGVKGFDRMPPEWGELTRLISSGVPVARNSELLLPVIRAWMQEVRDLSLIMSRQLGVEVSQKIPRKLYSNTKALVTEHLRALCDQGQLRAVMEIPDAAGLLPVIVDLKARSISASMTLKAPEDRKSAKARINWLLRQISVENTEGVFVAIQWPGRSLPTMHPLEALRSDPSLVSKEREHLVPIAFRVILNKRTGPRFGQVGNFISDLETIVPEFYSRIGQQLSSWTPPSPKIVSDRASKEAVDREAIQQEAEERALE